ncbi:MAG: glycosyltransferase family 39 protein [Candidatus Omnitrophica bacterium]|nr:glycosyltransferase family 39 protein [Candidatus Omnitrophota bacterium]
MIQLAIQPILWIVLLNLSLWGIGFSVFSAALFRLDKGFIGRVGFPYAIGLVVVSGLLFLLATLHFFVPLSIWIILIVGLLPVLTFAKKGFHALSAHLFRNPFDLIANSLLGVVCFLFFLALRLVIPPSMMGRLQYPDPEARLFYLFLMGVGLILFPWGASLWGRPAVDRILSLAGLTPGQESSCSTKPNQGWGAVMTAVLAHFFLFLFVPRFAHDTLAYHLVIPKTILNFGGFEPNSNLFFNMPQNWELLYTLPLWGGGPTAVKIFSFQHSVLVLITLFSFGRSQWGSTMGFLLAFLYLTGPTIQDHLQLAKVENSLSFMVLYTTLAFLKWRENEDTRWMILFGLLGGWLMGCKYTLWGLSGVFFLAALGVILKNRGLNGGARMALLLGAVWTVPVLPWLVKNFWFTGNPVYPNLFSLFGGANWSETLDRQLRHQYFQFFWEEHSGLLNQLKAVLLSPWDLIAAKHLRGRFSFLVILGLFLAPFLRESWRERTAPILLLALLGYIMWVLFPGNESRFLVPVIPLMILGAAPLFHRAIRNPRYGWIVLPALLLMGFSQLRFPRTLQLEAFTPEGYQHILETTTTTRYSLWREVEKKVPPDGRIAVFFEEQVYYLDRPYFYHWFGGNMEILRQAKTPETVEQRLTEDLGVTHLLLGYRDFNYYLSFNCPSKEEMDWEKDLMEEFLDRYAQKVLEYEDYVLFALGPAGERSGL